MSRYKVLPIKILRFEDEDGLREYLGERFIEETEPVFNRSGYYWYFDRIKNITWYEGDGRAFTKKDKREDIRSFKWTLNSANAKVLKNREINALKLLIDEHIVPRSIRDLYYYNIYRLQLRDVIVSSRKMMMDFLKPTERT